MTDQCIHGDACLHCAVARAQHPAQPAQAVAEPERLLSTAKVAERLDCSDTYAKELIADGAFDVVHLGRRRKVTASSVDRWIRTQAQKVHA